MTPLYMAAQENHIDVAKELLQHNADPHLSASVSRFILVCVVSLLITEIVLQPY